MANRGTLELFNATVTTTVNGSSFDVGQGQLSLAVVATSPVALTSMDGKFQHSPDGSTWFDLQTLTQITGATTQFYAVETAHFSNLRFIVTAITGTSVDIVAFAEAIEG